MRKFLTLAIAAIATALTLAGCAVVRPTAYVYSAERTELLAQITSDAGYVVASSLDERIGDDGNVFRMLLVNGGQSTEEWAPGQAGWGLIAGISRVGDCVKSQQAFVWFDEDGHVDLVGHVTHGAIVRGCATLAGVELRSDGFVTSLSENKSTSIRYSCLGDSCESEEIDEVLIVPVVDETSIRQLDKDVVWRRTARDVKIIHVSGGGTEIYLTMVKTVYRLITKFDNKKA